MTKYYVQWGDYQWCGVAESPTYAAVRAVEQRTNGIPVPTDENIYVDTRGYRPVVVDLEEVFSKESSSTEIYWLDEDSNVNLEPQYIIPAKDVLKALEQ